MNNNNNGEFKEFRSVAERHYNVVVIDTPGKINGPWPECMPMCKWHVQSCINAEHLTYCLDHINMFNYIQPIYVRLSEETGCSVYTLVDYRRRRPPMGKSW